MLLERRGPVQLFLCQYQVLEIGPAPKQIVIAGGQPAQLVLMGARLSECANRIVQLKKQRP